MKRLGPLLSTSNIAPTTRPGDWYANLVHVGRLQLVLGVSERTFLPVVVPAAPIATVVPRLRLGVGQVLGAIGIAEADIEKEDAEMEDVAYGKTASRQVTGLMVDFAKALPFHLDPAYGATPTLLDLSVTLSHMPVSPLYKTRTTVSPDRATIALFGARALGLVH
jgi:hypothetical protein